MKKIPLIVLTVIGAVFTHLPAIALPSGNYLISQSDTDSVTLQKSQIGRAQNLARQAAEQANGGLNNYRAEPAMFSDPKDAPYVENENGWVFTFKGGAPGDPNLTIESQVFVSYDFSTVNVVYNRAITK